MKEREKNISGAEAQGMTEPLSPADAGELRRKKKREKQLVSTVALVILAALLVVCYLLIAPKLAEDSTATDADETEAISVTAHQSSQVLSISFPSSEEAEGTITLRRGSSSAEWEYAEKPGFPLSDTKLSSLASAVASVSASREITDPAEPATYGLDSPVLTVNVGYADGTTRTFNIGSYNDYSQTYYLSTDGSSTVYTVDSTIFRAFSVSEDDLISLASLPSDVTYTGYSVTSPDGETDSYDEQTVSESFSDLLSSLELTGWAAFDPSEEEAATMGLDDDSAYTLTVSYSKEVKLDETNADSSADSVTTTGSYTLRVGGKVLSEDGTDNTSQRYLLYGDDRVVYKADSSVLDALISGVSDAGEQSE